MKTLVTSNRSHIGPAVVRQLHQSSPDAFLHGHDNAYVAACLTDAEQLPERLLDLRSRGDARKVDPAKPEGRDAVVRLAAVSNGPMGNRLAQVAAATDQDASAAKAGVRNFDFASGYGVHGVAEAMVSPRTVRVARKTRLISPPPMPPR